MTTSISFRTTTPPPNIAEAIANAAARTGVDFEYLVDQARLESGFHADARAATSSATGLYQFTSGTWFATVRDHGAKHGLRWAAEAIDADGKVADPERRSAILRLRNDPALAALMAAEHAADNRDALHNGTGRAPEQVDLYLAHFLGAAGAVRFLTRWQVEPHAAAAGLFPDAAGTNRAVFYDKAGNPRSLDAIRRRFEAKLAEHGVGRPAASIRRGLETALRPDRPLEMQAIQTMPDRLSLDFARDAYRRLSTAAGA